MPGRSTATVRSRQWVARLVGASSSRALGVRSEILEPLAIDVLVAAEVFGMVRGASRHSPGLGEIGHALASLRQQADLVIAGRDPARPRREARLALALRDVLLAFEHGGRVLEKPSGTSASELERALVEASCDAAIEVARAVQSLDDVFGALEVESHSARLDAVLSACGDRLVALEAKDRASIARPPLEEILRACNAAREAVLELSRCERTT